MSAEAQLKTGLLANFAGQAVNAIASFAFIPAYIAILGVEAYGLIGLFTVVLTAAMLLDAGMTPTLNREMASLSAGRRAAGDMRNLLFSVLLLCVAALVAATLLGLLAAPTLARSWLPPNGLDPDTVTHALTLMAATAVLRVVEGMLRGVLLGLGRPVLMNAVASASVLARAGGVLAPLMVLPSVSVFFWWQAATCLLSVLALAGGAFRIIGPVADPVRFDGAALYRLRGFAGGVLATSLIALVLTQADKIVLVRLTSLESFGYYAIAVALSAILYQGVLPISQAYYPHFVVRYGQGEADLSTSYHEASQLVATLVFAAAGFMFAFAHPLLLLWSGRIDVADDAAAPLRLLVIGSMFHCLMYIPYMLQLAAGWSRLAVIVNGVLTCAYLPLLWLAVSRNGAIGAAATLASVHLVGLLASSYIMHRRLLTGEWGRWIAWDLAPPALAVAGVIALIQTLPPLPGDMPARMAALALSGAVILAAAVLASPASRSLMRSTRKHPKWPSSSPS